MAALADDSVEATASLEMAQEVSEWSHKDAAVRGVPALDRKRKYSLGVALITGERFIAGN